MITEATEFRELWFIFSPLDAPWANIRLATFTKAVNAPYLELVVIHNEIDPRRIGVRVWDDITETEKWIKVRKIELPTAAEVIEAMAK